MTEYILSIYTIGILICIGVCLLGILFGDFFKDVNNILVRLVGAFSIVLIVEVVLVSKIDYWGYISLGVLAIVIIGLLIASELFMAVLLAFMKGGKEFLTSDNFKQMMEYMSPSEINEKKEEEVSEIKNEEECCLEAENEAQESSPSKSLKEIIDSFSEIEEKALKKYERRSHLKLDRNVKFGDLMLDAAVISPRSLNPYFIEVKIFTKVKFKSDNSVNLNKGILQSLRYTITDLKSKIEENIPFGEFTSLKHITLVIICVFNTDRELKGVHDAFNDLRKEHNKSKLKISFRFIAYNLSKIDD